MARQVKEPARAKHRKGHRAEALAPSRATTRAAWAEVRTEHRRIEEALAESEQKFRAVFDQATIGIALGNLDGRCVRANKAACNFIGATVAMLRNSRRSLVIKKFQ